LLKSLIAATSSTHAIIRILNAEVSALIPNITIRAVDDILLLIALINIFQIDVHFIKVDLFEDIQIRGRIKLLYLLLDRLLLSDRGLWLLGRIYLHGLLRFLFLFRRVLLLVCGW
jgi:hypothetical protein